MGLLASVLFCCCVLAAKYALSQEHGEEYEKTMGPVAFLWPPDREWGAAQDNTAPCGSAASVVNRTEFPLLNGQIALVAQDESWSIQVAISHKNDPTSNDDFEIVIAAMRIPELDEGHQCYPVPNPSADIEALSNATLQIQYTSDFEDDRNETYYACADITYVPTSQFTYQVPCFNATVDDFNITDSDPGLSSSASASGATATSEATGAAELSSSSGLSGGAIAGIVVGTVVGVAAFLGVFFFLWRRSQQKRRLRQQEASVRNVKWEDHHQGSGPASQASDRDIALRKL
ncbi:uncharacterized protein Z520_01587 [Fonsecaea multimorphosa CBS 102226]|uniref:Copper acquisition factor BIM1-like domain-containing protein n=1 Tax=Fonsecaea multimorphosa CBS 102226 TaxID=1442371 RepID=A0A0D2KI08_9EURO|nr:uncharacterized protein Z520_01587 [Fonsecaea multimorphosa CBS 102226]KIY03120.1 hypothetical protein Z520_01587 [Fonsecaea multimorphosa CBS 102226]OAL30367.1 hypothetical protein AYO22_01565 [Fonsecaea multimorphosa]